MKYEVVILWCTDDSPTHKSHIFQTCAATLNPKNKWLTNSTLIPHITHVLLLKSTPLLCKLSYVATLLEITHHAKNWAVGKALTFQKRPNTAFSCLISPFCKVLYVDFTLYTWLSSPFQNHSSSLSLHGLFLCILCNKVVTIGFSHSNHSLLHRSFQIHWSPFQTPISFRVASFRIEFVYILGKLSLTGVSPAYLSSQNFILFLIPIFHIMFLSNQFVICLPPHIFLISLHHHEL